jgi:serine/threonine protein kinase
METEFARNMSKNADRVKIGELLVRAGVLSAEQIDSELQVARTIGQPLGQILMRSGLITRYQLISAIQVQSMILDNMLTVDTGIEALRLVCHESIDLTDACKQVGMSSEKVWTCKLGELLVGAGIISTRQLLDAIASSFQTSVPLGQTLVRSKQVHPELIACGLNLQKQVREGQLTLPEALERLRERFAASKGNMIHTYTPDPIEASVKTPLEMTGELQAGTMDQVDSIFWKRIRRQHLEDQGREETPREKAEELIGLVLADRYEVISFIGSGGMSFVYMVRNRSLDSVLALKMMQPRLKNDKEMIARFKQEAQTVSCLNHPNVVAVHDFGVTEEGRLFMVMDFVPGVSLAELIATEGRLPPERALPIILQTCRAVAHAHERDVIHRDIKPSNIMVFDDEHQQNRVKIVDFGIAKLQGSEGPEDHKLTHTGQLFGSPLYMSPERCMGKAPGVSSDIYSIGCVLYELFAGCPPFVGTTVYEIFYKQMQQKPPGLSKIVGDRKLRKNIEEIITKCLAKDPAKRYQSMTELVQALEAVALEIKPQGEPPERKTLALLGEILEKAGVVTTEKLHERLATAQVIGQPIGETLLQFGDLTHSQLIAAVQLQSLHNDGVLTLEQVAEAMRIVCKDSAYLEEALEKIGFIERTSWTNKLGELLVAGRHLDDAALQKALYLSVKECRPLGHILMQEGMVRPAVIAKALSVQRRLREGLLNAHEGLRELYLKPQEETLFLDI